MKQVNIHEAKTRFSQLVAEVEAGEEIVIARAGKPVIRLVKESGAPKVYREFGGWEGWPGWDEAAWAAADAEILADFEESVSKPTE